MYVMVAPCILDPSLRAEGITTEEDLRAYERCQERCRAFGLEMVPLPCPETLFFGRERKPATYMERMNTQSFRSHLDELLKGVRRVIMEKGEPLCIIGADSSPTCGVNTTWYSPDQKMRHRGAFLSELPEIPAIDVYDFARYRVYLAAPLFSEAERRYNEYIRDLLASHCFLVYLPQEMGDDSASRHHHEMGDIFQTHCEALNRTDCVVAIIDGADSDSGTAWEMGYAYARGIPVISLRTDFRCAGTHEHVNLMLEQASTVVNTKEDLLQALNSPLTH